MANLTKARAIGILNRKIELIKGIEHLSESAPEFKAWQRNVEVAIREIFGTEGQHLKEFRGIMYVGIVRFDEYFEPTTTAEEIHNYYTSGLRKAKAILQSMIEEIEEYWTDDSPKPNFAEVEKAPKKYTDRELMERAIELSRQCVSEEGKESPKVGAIITRDGVILGEAYRGELSPGEHAEYTLLGKKLSGETLAGATLFTTLEPCTSRNKPKVACAQRVIERRLGKVVIGTLDRNQRIRGKGEVQLLDAGIQIAKFDSDLLPVIEELNRDFLRQVNTRKKRTPAETKDPVPEGGVGPNGFKIGYNEDGDKVEWIEEDGEIWPMILRRNDNHILEEYAELQDRVWYVRKLIMFENFESGKEQRRPESEPFIQSALEKMKKMEEQYGAENLVYDDIEWGIIQGKMAALAWVLGSDWEGAFDT